MEKCRNILFGNLSMIPKKSYHVWACRCLGSSNAHTVNLKKMVRQSISGDNRQGDRRGGTHPFKTVSGTRNPHHLCKKLLPATVSLLLVLPESQLYHDWTLLTFPNVHVSWGKKSLWAVFSGILVKIQNGASSTKNNHPNKQGGKKTHKNRKITLKKSKNSSQKNNSKK